MQLHHDMDMDLHSQADRHDARDDDVGVLA